MLCWSELRISDFLCTCFKSLVALLSLSQLCGSQDDGRPLTLSGQAGPATFGAPLLIGSSGNERREKKRGKSDRKEKKGSKKGHKEGRGHKGEKKKGLDIEKLRQERLQRERQERDRARQAIMGNIASAENGKKYNASYGNAAPVMRTQ